MCLTHLRRAPGGGRRAAADLAALFALLLAGCSSPSSPPQAPASSHELTAAVEAFVADSLSPGIRNVRAILVAVDGETLVELYYDSSAAETAPVASVTKSVVATLVGIAVSEGHLTLDQTLRELLPAHAAAMSPQTKAITVRHLLTMTAGLPGDVTPNDRPSGDDWVADILQGGLAQPPGQGFAYSNATSHLLAAILTEATGRPLLRYAREKLFDPLGIDTGSVVQPVLGTGRPGPARAYDAAGFAWPRDPQRVNVGFGYLKMSAADMMRLGNLYLGQGAWQGQRLLPEGWVEEATAPAVSTANGFGGADYGYQWWVTSARGHDAFAAIGYGGQIIEVVPDLRLVVVASTWIDLDAGFDSRTWQTMTSLVLVPLLEEGLG